MNFGLLLSPETVTEVPADEPGPSGRMLGFGCGGECAATLKLMCSWDRHLETGKQKWQTDFFQATSVLLFHTFSLWHVIKSVISSGKSIGQAPRLYISIT